MRCAIFVAFAPAAAVVANASLRVEVLQQQLHVQHVAPTEHVFAHFGALKRVREVVEAFLHALQVGTAHQTDALPL